jgi:hypothetical protein
MICLVLMPPSALDLRALEDALGPGRPETQVADQQLRMSRYPEFGVLLANGRLQLEATPASEATQLRAAAAYLLEKAAPFGPTALGFNAVAQIVTDEGEDPTAAFLDLAKIEERLGATDGRGGVEVGFHRDDARWTLTISPDSEDGRVWGATQNRHHEGFPADTDDLLDWFVGLDESYPVQIEELLRAE